jgi:ABC-type uncharacterized transport system permease subunit
MGKVTGAALGAALAIQAGWVVIAFFVAQVAWARGIRKYSAAGG